LSGTDFEVHESSLLTSSYWLLGPNP
jgi:hypothetical protein